jgi:tetratricopeptide (TPR) repeat protein
MPNGALVLEANDVRDASHWNWRLKDQNGVTVADHEVRLDTASWQYDAFLDLYGYLRRNVAPDEPATVASELVEQVGQWIGQHVLGKVGGAILAHRTPATVRVMIPREPEVAEGLLYLPLELAHVCGQPLAVQDVSLVFEIQGEAPPVTRQPVGERLRMLAIFSLPTDASALNLRLERYRLKKLINSISQNRGLAIDLRVVQYGVTRDALKGILKEQGGWDIIHFSGHGLAAGLVLEKPDGSSDRVKSDELLALLRPGRGRLKWVTLSACLSAARTIDETLRWLGLGPKHSALPPAADDPPKGKLGAVARELVREFGCAVLAMRFPVDDEFAIRLGEKLYESVLEAQLPLTRALQLALPEVANSPLAVATPALFGRHAAELALRVPKAGQGTRTGIAAAGMAYFDPPPERFVGRVKVMSQASAALAPRSNWAGVLFHGMAGGGKTACALELAYHYEDLQRFTGSVWYSTLGKESEWSGELVRFASAFEIQLSDEHLIPLLPLLHVMAESEDRFDSYLPRLRQFLEKHSTLLVLDNLESLLRDDGQWREPRWGKLVGALLSQRGESRAVLTSRTHPVIPGLAPDRLCTLPVHSLSLDESALLARHLPNLGALLRGECAVNDHERSEHRHLIKRLLGVVQGHAKLIELADGQAASPAELSRHLDRAMSAWAQSSVDDDQLNAFFREGDSKVEADCFLQALAGWTTAIAAALPDGSHTLFNFLCWLEEEDREDWIVDATWPKLWDRLALADAAPDVGSSLPALVSAGLVDVHLSRREKHQNERRLYSIHPGVAEAGRSASGEPFREAVDDVQAVFWSACFQAGLRKESEDAGPSVIRAGLSGAPYLMRQRRWEDASNRLEQVLYRSNSQATEATVLPLLLRLAEATEGTPREHIDAGLAATALARFGRWRDAEAMLRPILDRALDRNDFRVASVAANEIINVLMQTGRAAQALDLLNQKKIHTDRAGLGPWSQLQNEGKKLQLMNELRQYNEVLAEAEALRARMAGLSESAEKGESVSPWNVREVILNAAEIAAIRSGNWEMALALVDEIVSLKRDRGATTLDLTRARFNAITPLRGLRRHEEARELLKNCLSVFKDEGNSSDLASLFSAIAGLEIQLGHSDRALAHEKTAICYIYMTGHQGQCAISHFNLADYLVRAGGAPEMALAHRLAGAVIDLQAGGHWLTQPIPTLSSQLASFGSLPPPIPPSFTDLCRIVEQVDGVRFAELFARLPTFLAATGDEALQNVLKMVRGA